MKKRTIHPLFGLACCCIIAATALTSCRDHFDIDSQRNLSKLVVYCFPSQADTTYISVSNSMGVRKVTDIRKAILLHNARVSYTVNGQPRQVQQLADGTFYVIGSHQTGDHVSLLVEHDDYGRAEAHTTVPESTAITLQEVRLITEYDADWGSAQDFYQLPATFDDPAASTDYYAVRVHVKGDDQGLGIDANWPQVYVNDEPLLNRLTAIDEDFGFENDFYQRFYFFNDRDINGQQYTLHLNVKVNHLENRVRNPRFQVQLYRLTPEYYHYLKSINDIENNELAQGGFAQLTPTYSNVSGGLGLVAGFWASGSEWITVETQNTDE